MLWGVFFIYAMCHLGRLSWLAGKRLGRCSRSDYWVQFACIHLGLGFALGVARYWSDARATGTEIGYAMVGALMGSLVINGVVCALAWWTGHLLCDPARKALPRTAAPPKIVYPTGRKGK